MEDKFLKKLNKYAKVITKVGMNVQKGQLVVVRADIETKILAREIVKESYNLGASLVIVEYRDDKVTKETLTYADNNKLSEIKQYHKDKYRDYLDNNAVFVSIVGSDPNIFNDVNKEKLQIFSKTNSMASKEFSEALMSDRNSWCVVGASTYEWAKEVFKELDEKEAYYKLWDLIFKTARITDDEDDEKNWEKHIKVLKEKAKYLNSLDIEYLEYSTKKGTNLKIYLPKGYIFMAADSKNSKGVNFTANIPTEEVFTLADKNRIYGRVYSTKALNWNGNIIDEFYLDFEDGKVVNSFARIGEEALKILLNTDEGSRSLGEVALVPYDSPISNTKTLFYETLYDENASCHIALGKAYPTCISNGVNMTKEELEKNGVNDSLVHVDFMIGDETLNILATTRKGEKIKIFEDGEWA